MPRIRVDPDQLRVFAKQIREMTDLLRSTISSSNLAYMQLNWDTLDKTKMDDQVSGIRNNSSSLSGQVETLARFLESKATAFEAADRDGARSIEQSFKGWYDSQIEADRSGGLANGECVTWVLKRRTSLGKEPMHALAPTGECLDKLNIKYGNDNPLGAKHFIDYYRNSGHYFDTCPVDLRTFPGLNEGAAIVWDVANKTGHIAIVESVDRDGVWISEQNVPMGAPPRVRFIPQVDLESGKLFSDVAKVFIIPSDAEPLDCDAAFGS